MELRQLKYLIAVVDEGSYGAAAARFHVKHKTIQDQIGKLEKELSLRLLLRGVGGFRLTSPGRVFIRLAQDVLRKVERAHWAMSDLKDGCVAGEIRIGTVDSVGIYFLPKVLQCMREKYPGVQLTVLYRSCDEIIKALLSDRIDVALVDSPRSDRHLKLETIVEEQVSLVCGHMHPLFNRKHVQPKDIEGLSVISLSDDTSTGRLVQRYLARLGVRVKRVAFTDNIQTAKKMVEVGLGVTFLPDMITSPDISCQGKSLGLLARIKLDPACNRRIVLATWKRSKTERSMASFVKEIKTYGSQWMPCSESGAA